MTKQKVLIKDVPALIEVINLLVRFDEKTGRCDQYTNSELHYMRKVLCKADPANITVHATRDSEWLFFLEATLELEYEEYTHRMETAWLHEDGIFQERETAPPDHPVHKIVCLNDLYEASL
jgi:hypothetical protein